MKRRAFIHQSAFALYALSNFQGIKFLSSFSSDLSTLEETNLEQVLELFLPADAEFPGAIGLGAMNYFRWVLLDVDTPEKEKKRIQKGLQRLEISSLKENSKSFYLLTKKEKEDFFENFLKEEKNESWASLVLSYLFEASFSDPVYSGNKDEAAWKYVQYQAGFPRPPKRNWQKR